MSNIKGSQEYTSKTRNGVQSKKKNINTKTSKGKEANAKVLKIFKVLILIALMVVVFYPPYFRGLYFETEQLSTEIFIFCIFIAFWIYKFLTRDKRFIETPLDYAALGLVGVYSITIFTAVSTRMAISEWLKYCMYFAMFFMLSKLIDSYKLKILALWTIVASALGVSILGIDGAAGEHVSTALNGVFELLGFSNKVFFGLFENNTIHSTLQYPNALAAYLGCAYFVVLGLMVVTQRIWSRAVAGAVGFIVLITCIFTQSIGALITISICGIILLIVLPAGSRLRSIIYASALIIPTLIILIFSDAMAVLATRNSLKIWTLVIGGATLSFLLALVCSHVATWAEKVDRKVYIYLTGFSTLASIVAVVVLLNLHAPLEIAHSGLNSEAPVVSQKNIVLDSGKSYKLQVEVEATGTVSRSDVYTVSIYNKSAKDLLLNTSTTLATLTGNVTKGIVKKEISFKVPTDSRLVNINFMNMYKGSVCKFYSASLVDAETGKVVKEIVLQYKYLPEFITAKFEEFKGSNSSITREIFYKDGLKIFKDYWLLGAGGGAWQLLYNSYQSHPYVSNQAHNYYLQVGIETGILGVLIVVFLILTIVFMYLREYGFKNSNENNKERYLQGIVCTAILSLLLHSVIDFDLSLSAIALLLWTLIGIFNSRYMIDIERTPVAHKFLFINKLLFSIDKAVRKVKIIRLPPLVAVIIMGILLIVPSMLAISGNYAKKAVEAAKKSDLSLATQYMKKATELDSFKPQYKIDYANLLILGKEVSNEEIVAADKEVESASKIGRYYSDVTAKVGEYNLRRGKIEEALGFVDRSVLLKPLEPTMWHQKANIYMQVVIYYFNNGDYKSAEKYLDRALTMISEAKRINKGNLNPFVFNTATMELLEKLSYIKDSLSAKKELDIDKVIFYGIPDIDTDLDGINDQMQDYNLANVKLKTEDNILMAENNVTEEPQFIKTRALKLNPNKNYRISVEVANSEGSEGIPFKIDGISSSGGTLKHVKDNLFTAQLSTNFSGISDKNALMLGIVGRKEIKKIIFLQE
ncbi:MAG: O-antigen ligase family protein [Clostridia bacterium]|nr:O-antigen ligase family protein [Clostridia bacterium]